MVQGSSEEEMAEPEASSLEGMEATTMTAERITRHPGGETIRRCEVQMELVELVPDDDRCSRLQMRRW